MITVDQYMDIKQRLANGQSLHSIASDTGHSRNTVRRIQRSEHPLQKTKPAKPRPTRAQKLDPYRDYIRSRVEQFDLDATRILPEIQAMGYTGGVHTVRRYIRQLKQRTKLLSQATVRFETPPAKQAQCDWGHVGKFPDPSGKLIDIYVFVIVLSYSRQMFIRFTTSMKLPTLIECHQAAFDYFQGVPQSILYDNMSQVRSGPGRLNATFQDFAQHYSFDVRTHRPYRPRTKGKVERMVDYIKGNFLNGRDFAGLDDLNRQGQLWLDQTANVRIHGTTGQPPAELWQQEKDQLVPLEPNRPYVPSLRLERQVGKDSFVSVARSRYSVPPQYIGQRVEIQLQGTAIVIRSNQAIIAEHVLAQSPGQSVVTPEHIEALWQWTLENQPTVGQRHCNVRLEETVETCSLNCFEEVCA
jgi:transposase